MSCMKTDLHDKGQPWHSYPSITLSLTIISPVSNPISSYFGNDGPLTPNCLWTLKTHHALHHPFLCSGQRLTTSSQTCLKFPFSSTHTPMHSLRLSSATLSRYTSVTEHSHYFTIVYELFITPTR